MKIIEAARRLTELHHAEKAGMRKFTLVGIKARVTEALQAGGDGGPPDYGSGGMGLFDALQVIAVAHEEVFPNVPADMPLPEVEELMGRFLRSRHAP